MGHGSRSIRQTLSLELKRATPLPNADPSSGVVATTWLVGRISGRSNGGTLSALKAGRPVSPPPVKLASVTVRSIRTLYEITWPPATS
jgi:hypothetical protein